MVKKEAVVIGSGLAGLASGIRLQNAGFQVNLFEKRDKAGGRAYVYHDKGFTFDAGPTVITAPGAIEELFQICGKKMEDYVKIVEVSPFYRLFWENGFVFDYSGDWQQTEEQIRKKSPDDVEGYRKFLKYSKEVFDKGYTELADVPFLNFTSMLRVAPDLIRLRAERSVYSTIRRFIRDEQLREAFSFHSLLVGGNPFKTSSIYTLIHYLERNWGVHFAVGGTGALVDGLCRLFTDIGGKLHLNSPLEKILVEEKRVRGVRTQKGEEHPCELVLSNADIVHTYARLLGGHPRGKTYGEKLKNKRHSMSLFLIYFGTNREYPELAHHNIFFGPRYKELLDDIFYRGKLAEDFSLYLHAPTRTDKSLAPPGHECFYVLSPVPHKGISDVDWKTEGPIYAEKILEYMEKHYIPDLRKHLVTQRIFTPDDFETELNSYLGSAFSLEPILTQSAYMRPHNKDAQIDGLYFAGAGSHPGAGMPGVLASAKAAFRSIAADYELSVPKHFRPAPVSMKNADPQKIIAEGSKSFALASLFFSKEVKTSAHQLYSWLRYMDDQVDFASSRGLRHEEVLSELREKTQRAFTESEGHKLPFPFSALALVVREHQLPLSYANEFIEGMETDGAGPEFQSFSELELYCHRVAGVVGAMMCRVMGVESPKAIVHADDLGKGMQLTNICRDIFEDYQEGRIYLPNSLLEKYGLQRKNFTLAKNREQLVKVVNEILIEASKLYESGIRGLHYLSFRSALAVFIALRTYRAIGKRLMATPPRNWEERVYLSKKEKLLLALTSIPLFLLSYTRGLFRRIPDPVVN